jgi:mono/diheme cytochrome c family protein
MSHETDQPLQDVSDSAESQARDATVPVWLIVLMFLLLYWGGLYFDQNGAWFSAQVYAPYRSVAELEMYQPKHEGPDIRMGQAKFEVTCALCHGNDGQGKPGQAPPLAGSDWVNAEGVNRLVRIPVLGLNGPIEVKGQPYSFGSGMTPMAPNSARQSTFTDEELANVLTYIRGAWGNKAPPVTTEQVKAIRDELGNRSQALTVDELKSLPESK